MDADEAREALRQRARDAIARQPARTVTVLSSLLAVHDELGFLPAVAIEEVALRNAASPNEVWGVASFYPNFRFTPPNRHKVELCWGPTCHVLGAQPILQRLLAHLKLENEGDTADGVISFKLNTCLGVCAHGPAMSFDDELTGHMSADRAVRLVERVRADDEESQKAIAQAHESARSQRELRAKSEAAAKERAARAEAEAKAKAEAEAKAWEQYIEEAKANVAAEAKAKAEAAVAARAVAAETPAEYKPVDERPVAPEPNEPAGPTEGPSAKIQGERVPEEKKGD
jgi:NADH:ubiquinone oxidoreductase subunit E